MSDSAKKVGPEVVWKLMEKVAKSQEETSLQQKETDRHFKEMSKEADLQRKEADLQRKETDHHFKKMSKEAELQREKADLERKETDRYLKKMSKEAELQREKADLERKETDRHFKEMSKEAELQREEAKLQREKADLERKETDRYLKEISKKADIRHAHLEKRTRELNELFTGQWGKLIESLVKGDLVRLLNERNIQVMGLAQENFRRRNGEEYEVDIIAVNGREVVVVEVKTTLKNQHLDHFIEKLGMFKDIFPEYKDKIIYGAIAYLKANEGAHNKAEKKGLFVIRATGNSATITNQKEFSPKVF